MPTATTTSTLTKDTHDATRVTQRAAEDGPGREATTKAGEVPELELDEGYDNLACTD
jgi:hypothetical protein